MEPDLQFEFRWIERRFASLWAVAVLLGLVAVASLAWSLGVGRAARRSESEVHGVRAMVDSLEQVARGDTARFEPLEERLATVGELRHQIRLKADRSTMAAIQTRLEGISDQLGRTDSLLGSLRGDEARIARGLALATDDSVAALRRMISWQAARQDSADLQQHSRLEALDLRVGALDDARKRSGRGTALRDGITLVNTGMIVAHIIGHSGR